MAEFRKLPTQAELQNMLFMEQMRVKNPQQIAQEALASGTTVSPIPENVFQKIAGGARTAGEFVNRAGSAADLAKLFPGYKTETRVNIPTGYNFAPKQDPMGGVIPGGLQTQNVNLGQVLGAIKPADVLGITGAERAYSDIGAGKAPQPLDVLDVAGLGATGLVGGKAALRATKGVPVGMSIQEAKGLLTEAPRSPLGFYSALEESALNLQRNKGSGQAFLNDLQKAPNVKADEIKWTGLDEFLKTKPNVTKQEVQDYLANNRVEVQEVQLGGVQPYNAQRLSQLESEYKTLKQHPIDDPSFGEEKYNELIRLTNIRDQSTTETLYDSAERAMQNAQRAQRQGNNLTAEKYFREAEFFNTRAEKLDLEGQGMSNPPKFGKYTLPGGENYREILLTMPVKIKDSPSMAKLRETVADMTVSEATREAAQAQLDNIAKIKTAEGAYKSTHFDQPNILAHLRVNDRVDADGKKMLLVEEVQSDWHQAGREKGYQQSMIKKEDIEAKFIPPNVPEGKDPRAYVGHWELFDKRTGERITQASGHFDEEQAIRNGLHFWEAHKKGVPDAPFKDSWYQLALKRAIQYAAENGYDRIGLTTAERQIKRYPDEKNVKGMKKYYDEVYPKFLEKYGKKWGASVGETTVPTDRANVGGVPSMYPNQEPIRYLDVTPEMKASVSKGQPLFQALPAIPATGLLATQDENR